MAKEAGLRKNSKEMAGTSCANKLQTILEDPKTTPGTSEGATPIDDVSKSSCCPAHQDKELELYCLDCDELICCVCVMTNGKHDRHDYEQVSLAFIRYKKKMASLLEEQVVTVKKALASIKQRYRVISNQQAVVEGKIHVTFRQLQEVLTAREIKLVGQLRQTTQDKLKSLSAQSVQIENTLTRLTGCLHFMRKSIEARNDDKAPDPSKIQVKGPVVMKSTAPLPAESSNSSNNKESSKSVNTPCLPLGGVKGPKKEVAGLKSASCAANKLQTILKDTKITPATSEGATPIGELCPTHQDEKLKVYCRDCDVVVCYKCASAEHKRHEYTEVHVDFIRYKKMTTSLLAKKPLYAPFLIPLVGVKGPRGVAINQSGEVVVSEGAGDCVSVFSPDGKKLRSFGTKGSSPGQFNCPYGLTVDSEGNILVADSLNQRIQKFTAKGQFLAAVGNGSGPLQFNLPTDIAFDANHQKFYVADHGNRRLQVLNSDLTLYRTFGWHSRGEGELRYPFGMGCDSSGKVYVADIYRVQAFSPYDMSTCGQDKKGVDFTVDPTGLFYTSKHKEHTTYIFTSELRLSTSSGGKGVGLAVSKSPDGYLYECDHYRNSVRVYCTVNMHMHL